MQRFILIVALAVAGMGAVLAQDSHAAPQNAPVQQSTAANGNAEEAKGGQPMLVVLAKTLDAKKLKAGDLVMAKVDQAVQLGDGTVVPPGSSMKGHVTSASARSKGDAQSSVALVFDNIVLKNGQQLAVQTTIQAVGAPPIISPDQYGSDGGLPTMNNPGTPTPPGTMSPTGPMGGGAPVGGMPQPQGNPPQTAGGQRNSSNLGGLTTQSTGVVGLRNIELQPNSTLTSTAKDLKLDSGTEIVLRVQSR